MNPNLKPDRNTQIDIRRYDQLNTLRSDAQHVEYTAKRIEQHAWCIANQELSAKALADEQTELDDAIADLILFADHIKRKNTDQKTDAANAAYKKNHSEVL